MKSSHKKRDGQIWSTDFSLSLLIFSAAALLSILIITNLLQTDDYELVARQVKATSDVVLTEGYPRYWTNSTVIRAGIVSDDHLSLRKWSELGKLSDSKLRSTFRTTDYVYLYLTNESNETVALAGSCGIGSLLVTSTPRNISLQAALITPFSAAGLAPVIDLVQSDLTPRLTSGNISANISAYDMLLIEGNFVPSMTKQSAAFLLENAALRGITVVLIGDPGFPVFGINVNLSNTTNIDIQNDQGKGMGFSSGDVVTLTDEIATIETPTAVDVSDYTAFGLADNGKAAYATWLFRDARIWYFATSGGTIGTDTVVERLGMSLNSMINASQPQCGDVNIIGASQIATRTRSVAFHDHIVTVHALVWRG